MGYSDPEVVSVLLSWLGLRATLNGEVCTLDFQLLPSCGFTWNLVSISPSPLFFYSFAFAVQMLLEECGSFFGSPR